MPNFYGNYGVMYDETYGVIYGGKVDGTITPRASARGRFVLSSAR